MDELIFGDLLKHRTVLLNFGVFATCNVIEAILVLFIIIRLTCILLLFFLYVFSNSLFQIGFELLDIGQHFDGHVTYHKE